MRDPALDRVVRQGELRRFQSLTGIGGYKLADEAEYTARLEAERAKDPDTREAGDVAALKAAELADHAGNEPGKTRKTNKTQ